ncbi:MAG TPA: nucleoside recognition domain-containing protein [Ferruginibacter sp.]|nr:nucleoside recognition domain-containing protein [Ferruginibacter sp.]HMP20504.1 nucleoside recognition domain-containing protein [Ferruginibacter sp.]
MALSKIWSAFIVIAIVLAGYKCLFVDGQSDIFSRMVAGKADDSYSCYALGAPAGMSVDSFFKKAAPFAYSRKLNAEDCNTIVTDDVKGDSVVMLKAKLPALKVFTYAQVLNRLQKPVDGVIETCKAAVNICIGLIGIMALFMGFMGIAERAGGVRFLSRIIGPFFSKIFPELPKGHPALGHMVMNFSANLLGLDNAATPFGLKAMESLQEINPNKAVASNSQIMFLCMHASGPVLIPVSIIAIRASARAANPTDIFIPCMIATFVATVTAMCVVAFKQRIQLFNAVVLGWLLGLSAIIAALVLYITRLDADGVQSFSGILSNGLILLIFILIVAGGLYKKIDLFDAFISGAKGGFETAVKIIPYLVGMLVAISMLRNSGAFDVVINGLKNLFTALGTDTGFVDGLPTAIIKPFSGGGARGMMVDTMKTFGPDSFAGRLSCVLQGSSDTTFYVIAVYFGAVAVKNTRYTIGVMLLADLVAVVTAIGLSYLFFGS